MEEHLKGLGHPLLPHLLHHYAECRRIWGKTEVAVECCLLASPLLWVPLGHWARKHGALINKRQIQFFIHQSQKEDRQTGKVGSCMWEIPTSPGTNGNDNYERELKSPKVFITAETFFEWAITEKFTHIDPTLKLKTRSGLDLLCYGLQICYTRNWINLLWQEQKTLRCRCFELVINITNTSLLWVFWSQWKLWKHRRKWTHLVNLTIPWVTGHELTSETARKPAVLTPHS